MIQKIRNHWSFKGVASVLIFNILFEILLPLQLMSLTEGPSQPEFNSFTPVGTSDMVDLSSGDMNYNIPLMDVGGYPLNLAYNSGVSMDQEATWVGLGWNLSVGQINREVRGLPDDFKGDGIQYENHTKANVTVGVNLQFTPALFGKDGDTVELGGNLTHGLNVTYNNYDGLSLSPSINANFEIHENASVGFSAQSGPDGLNVSPKASIHAKYKTIENRSKYLGLAYGLSMNSRQGLTSQTLNFTSKITETTVKERTLDDGSIEVKTGKKTLRAGATSGSTVSFINTSYTPSKRVGMYTQSYTFNAGFGAEFFGLEGQARITGYATIQNIRDGEDDKTSPAYGYKHTEFASKTSVLDFNREKDGNFTANSTNLPVTNYTYDIYSIQGQGISGMFRPYRSQVGYIYDPEVVDGSTSASAGAEFGSGNAFHLGVDAEVTQVKSSSGVWEDNNDVLYYFKSQGSDNPANERVYYKSPGDLSRDKELGSIFEAKLGAYSPIRFGFAGGKFNRRATTKFSQKTGVNSSSEIGIQESIQRSKRQLRNQSVAQLSKEQVMRGVGYGPLMRSVNEWEDGAIAINDASKNHHTAEIQVTRNDGARYIYGLPVYNSLKKEATFAIRGTAANGLISYADNDASINNSVSKTDHYFNRITTPAYVHTYLLTNVLSADYQDRSGNGPTEDDFGSYTKFTYFRNSGAAYRWRVPYKDHEANYNEGLKSNPFDDQASYVYGEKEIIYLEKIETKTHVAIITYSDRDDARGVIGENGGMSDETSQILKKIDRIDLYTLADYKANGEDATPIKTAHFEYDYSLCDGIDNNVNGNGKLTLRKVYFTYRNSKMGKYNAYSFTYGFNPDYNIKTYDMWGNLTNVSGGETNSSAPTNSEFPYVNQDKTSADQSTAAWSLSQVDLPSGGKIEIDYESDDYAYVQDRDAMRMFKVIAASDQAEITSESIENTTLYDLQNGSDKVNRFLVVQVPDDIDNYTEFYDKCIRKVRDKLLYFRFLVNMSKEGGDPEASANSHDFDFVTGYCVMDDAIMGEFEEIGGIKYASIPVETVDKEGRITPNEQVNPISKASWNFGRKYLSKQVLGMGVEDEEELDPEKILQYLLLPELINNLREFALGPNAVLRNKLIGRRFMPQKSWIRLGDPSGKKLGGGCRVKEVIMDDAWSDMNNGSYQTMRYGQKYQYTLTDDPASKSSGVATYEPAGSKENPFVEPIYSYENRLLAPDEENYIEKPLGECFFPSPTVTYSRVKVTSRQAGTGPGSGFELKKQHKTGSVVTEFYTSRDYPTLVDQTDPEIYEDKQNLLTGLLKAYQLKELSVSQGYSIHLNDMNGKQKSQRVYAEGQSDFISGVDYLYDGYSAADPTSTSDLGNASAGRLNNRVKVISPTGQISEQVLGVEYDVVHDFRENKTNTITGGVNGNLAGFVIGIFPGICPFLIPDFSFSRDRFHSASTTKVIHTFGILKETIAYDAGASVSTRNLAWDELTGEVLLTETVDEFNDKYYSLNYPAHWAYPGMGPASHNLGMSAYLEQTGDLCSLVDVGSYQASDFLINGDEIYLLNDGSYQKGWVHSVSGAGFKILDESG